MKYHKNVCKKRHENVDLKESELIFNSGDGFLGNWKFDQESIRKSIAEMIILDELPFKLLKEKDLNDACHLHVLGFVFHHDGLLLGTVIRFTKIKRLA